MPAVSICDPVSATLRRTLDTSQSKGQDELSSSLVTSASRILQSEVQYKEVNDYQSAILDQLKAKYTVLSLPNSENDEKKDGIAKKKGPCLPEPAVTLFLAKKVSLGWKGTFPVGAGMFNVGNTCYLNSTLQALFHVPALVNWLLSDSHHNSKCEQNDGAGECLTCAMAKTLQFSHQKSGCAIKPFYIYNKLKLICRTMVPGQQEDAHEFLRYLLDGMKKAYLTRHKANKLDNYSKETTPINQIFGGYVRTEVKCLQCRHVSTTFQHFQDLLVDIRKATTLDEALATYFSREQLENNDYKCEACKRRVPATKQFSVERAPKVLCVQLKRFNVLGGKISKHISFKQTIDMGPYLWREPGEPQQSLTYKLTSMVTHMGPSVNCGHYTAVAKVSTGQYYSFDDSCVRPVSLSNVLSTNAYIMIFEMEPSNLKVNGSISSPTISPVSQLNKSTVGTPKASTSGSAVLNGSVNGLTSKEEDVEKNSSNGVQVKGSGFIGPQLPQKMMEKQPRLIMHIKNGRILNGNCLVPYDGSSEEEENLTSSNGSVKSMVPVNVPNSKSSPVKKENPLAKPVNSTKEAQKSLTKINGNEIVGKVQKNGASYAVVKYQNEKAEANGGTVKSSKWHQTVRGCKDEEKVATKASSIKGWQVSKDTSFGSATSLTAPNGWSVTDKEDNKLPQGTSTSTTTSTSTGATIDVNINSNTTTTTTPSAAAVRNFNGTNQSDTVSHLLRMSLRRYGNSGQYIKRITPKNVNIIPGRNKINPVAIENRIPADKNKNPASIQVRLQDERLKLNCKKPGTISNAISKSLGSNHKYRPSNTENSSSIPKNSDSNPRYRASNRANSNSVPKNSDTNPKYRASNHDSSNAIPKNSVSNPKYRRSKSKPSNIKSSKAKPVHNLKLSSVNKMEVKGVGNRLMESKIDQSSKGPVRNKSDREAGKRESKKEKIVK